MWIVTFKAEVLIAEGEEVFYFGIQPHGGQGARFPGELEARLVEVVGVEVEVAKGVDEVSRLKITNLGDHEGEQAVTGDVEGDAEEEVGTALVELAA